MGQVRQDSATTMHADRVAIQRSQALLLHLFKELGSNPKTIAKWRKLTTVKELKTGLKHKLYECSPLEMEGLPRPVFSTILGTSAKVLIT